MGIPVINVIGFSGSGKTTLMVALIAWFKQKGYKIATIKHHSKTDLEIDTPGKDSWRHAQAGSDLVVISSPNKLVEYRNLEEELLLEQVVSRIEGVDLILVEGYKHSGKFNVLVLAADHLNAINSLLKDSIAVAADFYIPADLLFSTPQFSRNDVDGIASLIREKFLKAEMAAGSPDQTLKGKK